MVGPANKNEDRLEMGVDTLLKAHVVRAISGVERLRLWLLTQSWFMSFLLPALPRQVRWALRTIYLAPVDYMDRKLGRHQTAPPKAYNSSGASIDFEASGDAFVRVLREVAGLNPSISVLDIGCGYGRLAAAMAKYLDANGSYHGLDIIPQAIKWCSANIKGVQGNVQFTLADIRNKEYHPAGLVSATAYRFPFQDNTFDLVVLCSVFTHMLPPDVDNYMREIARILKPNGQCYATYFLLTSQSRSLMSSKESTINFKYDCGSYWVVSKKVPELSVGYDEGFVQQLYAKNELTWRLYPGNWCGGESHWPRHSGPGSGFSGDQDVVVAAKKPGSTSSD
jgi:SAM-dependent methyltransferase